MTSETEEEIKQEMPSADQSPLASNEQESKLDVRTHALLFRPLRCGELAGN